MLLKSQQDNPGGKTPLLEEIGDKRWSNNKDYKDYKKNTPIFFPKIF